MNFDQQIYTLLRQVPRGQVTTYKALAEALNTKAYQAVGNAMKNNPDAPRTPCHRVVKSNGRIGGFQGHKTGATIERKIKLLSQEGVKVEQGQVKNFPQVLFTDFQP